MRTDVVSHDAAKGKLTLQYPTVPELCLFYMLKVIYADYKSGTVNLDNAKMQKKQAIGQCERFDKERDDYLSVYAEYQKNIKIFHDDITAIEKSRDKDEMLSLAMDVIGKFIGDESFRQRQERKIEDET